ncbi:MAG: hypothetical protein H6606_08975 [Flavobacteriales bacterium]|nr:hypothetical protein [Flavobacteriales bacterium]
MSSAILVDNVQNTQKILRTEHFVGLSTGNCESRKKNLEQGLSENEILAIFAALKDRSWISLRK